VLLGWPNSAALSNNTKNNPKISQIFPKILKKSLLFQCCQGSEIQQHFPTTPKKSEYDDGICFFEIEKK
jgi:hypothetical protein